MYVRAHVRCNKNEKKNRFKKKFFYSLLLNMHRVDFTQPNNKCLTGDTHDIATRTHIHGVYNRVFYSCLGERCTIKSDSVT